MTANLVSRLSGAGEIATSSRQGAPPQRHEPGPLSGSLITSYEVASPLRPLLALVAHSHSLPRTGRNRGCVDSEISAQPSQDGHRARMSVEIFTHFMPPGVRNLGLPSPSTTTGRGELEVPSAGRSSPFWVILGPGPQRAYSDLPDFRMGSFCSRSHGMAPATEKRWTPRICTPRSTILGLKVKTATACGDSASVDRVPSRASNFGNR